jgi:hypothetical protein
VRAHAIALRPRSHLINDPFPSVAILSTTPHSFLIYHTPMSIYYPLKMHVDYAFIFAPVHVLCHQTCEFFRDPQVKIPVRLANL